MKKRILSGFMALLMVLQILCMVPAEVSAEAATGTCGDNLTWTLDDNGVLTISGTGAMDDYWIVYENEGEADTGWLAVDETEAVSTYSGSTTVRWTAPWSAYQDDILSVVITDGVTNVGDDAFYRCENLETVSLPDSVTEIGVEAFYICTSLSDFTLPDSVTTIGNAAFMDCAMLPYIPATNGITSIGTYAFSGCTSLTSVVLLNCQTVANGAFNGCTGLTTAMLGESLTTLGNYAFYSCSELTEITFLGNAPTIDTSTFYDVTATVTYPIGNETYTADVMQNYGGTLTWVTDYVATGTCGDNLTWTLDENGVLTISGTGAMDDYWIVYENEGEADTGWLAVDETEAVSTYSGSTTVRWTAPWSAYQDDILSVVITDGVTNVGDKAFYYCENLEMVSLPDSVTEIGVEAFYICTSLSDCTLPDSVTTIGNAAFKDCAMLPNIPATNGLTDIGMYAFYGCTNLTELTLSNCVSVGIGAFAYCSSLTKVTLGEALTTLKSYAFDSCNTLTEVTFLGDVPDIASDAFSEVTAEVSYPTANETYTADVMQNYGGTLTWRKPSVIPTLQPKYPSLSFEGEVYYNVIYTVTDGEDIVQMGLITYNEMPGEDTPVADTIPGYVKSGDVYIVHTNGISAKNLGDLVYFRVYALLKDGTYAYSDVYSYSAKLYAEDRIANSSNENMKKLCVAMLNYGAAAQIQFNYKTDTLMNADLTAEQQALISAYDASMQSGLVGVDSNRVGSFASSSTGYETMYPSVSFEGVFSINYNFFPALTVDGDMVLYYWDLDTYMSVTELTADNATGSIVMTQSGSGYKGTVTDIAAKNIDETIFVAGVYASDGVSHATGVLPYSIGAYCADRIANGSETMQALAAATAVYGYYANSYFA